MTVLLSKPYATYAQGATVDLDNATEASLVAQGLGVYTTNPGSTFFPLTAKEQQASRDMAATIAVGNTLPRWTAALKAQGAGTRNAKLAIYGDSTTVGAFANTGAAYANNNMASSWPYLLARLLIARGYATNTNSVFGDVTNTAAPATLAAHDTRRSFGAGWVLASFFTLGGQAPFNNTAGDQTVLGFTPSAEFDTITILSYGNGTYGKFAVNIDGGAALTNLSINGGAANQSQVNLASYGAAVVVTAAVPKGTHTIGIYRSAASGSDGGLPIIGVLTSLSTARTVDIINCGAGGSTTTSMSANSSLFMPLAQLANQIAPDLTVICLDINDWIAGLAAGTFDLATTTTHSFQLQKIITAAKASGDVILMTGCPSAVGTATLAAQNLILTATRNLAVLNNIPLVDISAAWGSHVQGLADGWYAPNNDTVHPGLVGYGDIAARVAAMPWIS